MLRRIVIFAGGALVVLILLAIVIAAFGFPLLRYLSQPKNLPLAKRNGEALARVHGETIVAVVAHPDDAEWYAGGTLATLARHGNRVVVVDGTSGEKGGNLPNLGKIREGEQKRAGAIIGYSRIVYLRNPDRGLVDDAHFRRQLLDVFRQENPSILITFDAAQQALGYRHPDHRAAGEASLEVAVDFPTFRAAYLFSSASPNAIVDVTPVVKVKGQALAQNKSQRQGSSFARVFLRLFRFLPRSATENLEAGSAGPYPGIGIKFGEPFRLVRISH